MATTKKLFFLFKVKKIRQDNFDILKSFNTELKSRLH